MIMYEHTDFTYRHIYHDVKHWNYNCFSCWDSLHARLKSHYEAWSYKKKKHKKIKTNSKPV